MTSRSNRQDRRETKAYTKSVRIKLTPAQHRRLNNDAGSQPVSEYVRDKIFDVDPAVSHLADVAREIALARNLMLSQLPADPRHIDLFLDLSTKFREMVDAFYIQQILSSVAPDIVGQVS